MDSSPNDKRYPDAKAAGYVAKRAKRLSESRQDCQTAIIFSTKNYSGALQDALKALRASGANMVHIESRPSKQSEGEYEFFVTTNSAPADVKQAVENLKEVATNVTLLDNNPTSDNPAWFPRTIRDLDIFAERVLDAGHDLNSNHPGFTDPVYRKRRAEFADIALAYKHGTPIPHIAYTEEEKTTWKKVFTNLKELYPTHACAEFNAVFPLLEEHCGYVEEDVPQLEGISQFLQQATGFRLRPVAGLLSSRDFLAGLAFRVFHSTQYIRHPSKPFYTPEPDICHEILGHVPLFADRSFAEFSQEIGLASLGASDEDIKRLATCYWFTIEYGICRQGGKLKAYGAGLLSSFGELEYCLSDKPEIREFEPEKTGVQEYPVTEFQPVYFVAGSFEAAKTKMREFASTLKKPFTARYNPYTQSVELVDNASAMKEVVLAARHELNVLLEALERRG